jgi:hypothetical protein
MPGGAAARCNGWVVSRFDREHFLGPTGPKDEDKDHHQGVMIAARPWIIRISLIIVLEYFCQPIAIRWTRRVTC